MRCSVTEKGELGDHKGKSDSLQDDRCRMGGDSWGVTGKTACGPQEKDVRLYSIGSGTSLRNLNQKSKIINSLLKKTTIY